MVILHTCAPFLQSPGFPLSSFSRQENCSLPFWAVRVPFQSFCGQPKTRIVVAKAGRGLKLKTQKENEGEDGKEVGYGDDEEHEADDGFSSRSGFVGRGEGKEFDRDPEFAEIMGACLDDPQKARSKVSPFFFFCTIGISLQILTFFFGKWWFLQFWCLCF